MFKPIKHSSRLLACAFLFTCPINSALAIEGNGLPIYPDGLESFLSGALPEPGIHALVYTGSLRYTSVRDRDGKALPIPNFKAEVGMIAPRVIWVTPTQVLGGQLAFHALFPLLTVKETVGNQSRRRQGLGDIAFGPALGYHFSESSHAVIGIDFIAPTGRYRSGALANLGRNYWTIQPAAAFSYMQPQGLNFDVKAMLDFNTQNRDTHTRSGHAFHADYTLGYGFNNGWVAGLGGYVYQQLQHDSGPFAADGKARAFAVGPAIRYANPQGWLFTAKWQKELGVRSRPKGQQLMLKAAIPF